MIRMGVTMYCKLFLISKFGIPYKTGGSSENITLNYSQIIPLDITIENTGTAYLIKWRNTGLPGRGRAMTIVNFFAFNLNNIKITIL